MNDDRDLALVSTLGNARMEAKSTRHSGRQTGREAFTCKGDGDGNGM